MQSNGHDSIFHIDFALIDMFCLVPTARFEDIYFADHHNYIYYSYFLQLFAQPDRLGKLSPHMLVYVKRQQYIACQIWNQTKKRGFFLVLGLGGETI